MRAIYFLPATLLVALSSGCGRSANVDTSLAVTSNDPLNSPSAPADTPMATATPGATPAPAASPTATPVPASTPFATPTPNNRNIISNIQSIADWAGCGSCADPGGAGANAPYSYTLDVASPSISGASTQFWLGGSTPYTNALFTNHLGGRAGASNFVLDFDLYAANPSDAQALEFDIFYSRDGLKNYFLTECDTNGMYAGTWQVQNIMLDTWIHTGLPCTVNSNAWNHVTLEFDREADGNTRFVSASMNGNSQYINQIYASLPDSGFEMTAGVQLDGNAKQTNFSIWIDRMSITYW